MGAFLAKPKTGKHNDCGSGNGLRYGLSSMQGWRVEMEDAHCAVVGLQPPSMADWSFFAIFDGHAGGRVSTLCAEQLLDSIVTNDDFRADATAGADANWQPSTNSVQRGIKTGFLELDARMRRLPEVQSGEDKSGSTAVCALVSPHRVFFSNCGDSRALLSRAGQVVFATHDHKPADPEERARIQKAGGSVMIQRVNGSLAVSRALGDYDYKNVFGRSQCDQLVSPEPEVSVEERAFDTDEFAVLACDGIWDVMSNEELAAFVKDRMLLTDDLVQVCNQVVDTCLYKGSRDNMSIVIIAFEGAPTVDSEAQMREAELDRRLEAKVKDLLEKEEPPDSALVPYVMHLLALEEIEGLPPGGGLSAKRTTIKTIVNQIIPPKTDSD